MKSFDDYRTLINFLAPSLATAAAASAAAAPAGVLVVLRRDTLLALALPQVVAMGVAAGLRLGLPPLPAAAAFVAAALALVARARTSHRTDLFLPALYVAGLAVSILLIVHSGAHLAEVQNLFTGIDVAVAPDEARWAVPLLLLPLLPLRLFWRRWLLLAQAPATAAIAGVRAGHWHLLFLACLSQLVLVGTGMLGVVLVLAMLFLPAAAVLPWARRLPTAMTASLTAAAAAFAAGFVLSIEMEWPLSHSIAAAGAALAAASLALRAVVKR
jgi:zinc/manganese transport system permease protein